MNKRRKILAAMLAAFMLLVPMVSTAQIVVGGENPEDNFTGTFGTMQITDNETGDYVPLGEGLWLLAGAAGLYLLVKSRKTRKATAVAAAALALTLGTAQCKKTEESVIPAGETISISFMAGNGAKADINVNTGSITWNEGDKVYVVCNDATPKAVLLGEYLTAKTGGEQETEISGNVTVPSGSTLPETPSFTFYYVGSGVTFDKANFTFDISKQNGQNDVDLNDSGEYMVGRTGAVEMEKKGGKYGPVDPGAKHFDPLTSVLRLETNEFGANQTLTMSGGNSEMTINLAGDATPSYTAGSITFTSGDNVQISVIPTTAGDATLSFSGNGMDGSITVTNGIKAGRIYSKVINNAGYPIHVDANGSGVLPGKFSINATEYVQFSRGNLQATYHSSSSSYTWAFAANQYDFIGNAAGNTTIASQADNAVVDLFGWSTATTNYGINISTSNSSYSGDFKDWGGLAIGGYEANTWHTLSKAEWDYLLNSRDDATNLRKWVTLTDVSVPGFVFLPDGTNPSVMDLITTTSDLATYNAVFLPAAGKRLGTGLIDVGVEGFYWPSTPNGDVAYGLYFCSSSMGTDPSDRYYGYAVRLVQKSFKPHDAVYIGGKYWATTNIGASTPKEKGWYFSRGNVTGYIPTGTGDLASSTWKNAKSGEILSGGFTWENYQNTSGYSKCSVDIPVDVEFDAARANWGKPWRMPTHSDIVALKTATYWRWNSTDKGYYVFAPNPSTDAGKINSECSGTYDDSNALLFFPLTGASGGMSSSDWFGYVRTSTYAIYHENQHYDYNLAYYPDISSLTISATVNPDNLALVYMAIPIRPVHD